MHFLSSLLSSFIYESVLFIAYGRWIYYVISFILVLLLFFGYRKKKNLSLSSRTMVIATAVILIMNYYLINYIYRFASYAVTGTMYHKQPTESMFMGFRYLCSFIVVLVIMKFWVKLSVTKHFFLFSAIAAFFADPTLLLYILFLVGIRF
jgi:hypothetical protein